MSMLHIYSYTGDTKPQMASSAGNVNDLCQNLQAMSQVPSVDGLQTLVESIQKVGGLTVIKTSSWLERSVY